MGAAMGAATEAVRAAGAALSSSKKTCYLKQLTLASLSAAMDLQIVFLEELVVSFLMVAVVLRHSDRHQEQHEEHQEHQEQQCSPFPPP